MDDQIPNSPYFAAIGGPTCSGKTQLTRYVAQLALSAAVVPLDAYYRDLAALPPSERAKHNFDHPDALDWPLIRQHLANLATGTSITLPRYDFATHARVPGGDIVVSAPIILIEGLFALYDPTVRARCRTCVYVDLDDPACLQRRMTRDTAERGRTPESVQQQYAATVRPMAQTFVAPTRAHAHLVLRGDLPTADAAAAVLAHIQANLGNS